MKMTELKDSVATLLAQPGWNQSILAQKSGVDQSIISRIVNGKIRRGVGIDTLDKLMPFLPPVDSVHCSMGNETRQ